MKLRDFDYSLPPERIAQSPAPARDASRLMVVPLAGGPIEHRTFPDLPKWLRKGDLLVLNDTRVVPARLILARQSGGRVEALLLRRVGERRWEALLDPGRRLQPGEKLRLEDGSSCRIGERGPKSAWTIEFEVDNGALDRLGRAPLPPYIKRPDGATPADLERYQTVYAERPGSIAAPTAGLHFTRELLARIAAGGVAVERVTLHVGTGTFLPVRADDVEEHVMESEAYEIPVATLQALDRAQRVVAVGTTSCRTLEAWARTGQAKGSTDLFIRPPFEYKVVDGLLTNFHLPKSTLLMLVCAFAGRERTLAAYEEAVKEKYRFFSYGDASLWI
ncbi:MAG TPA: tRNA preQ1(34) S-adenosylmethionine ribosyltransferase-isomerase QueA [Planctomycetota bacterium]|nr:tRNA preQ1(34) S-adenosylmethionine ribosyltransferase-isomerase QueA [Planctomycetota bacterium]